MTVFRRGGTRYHYQFQYRKKRYSGTTEQVDRRDAEAVEAQLKKRLRQSQWDIGPLDRTSTPTFTEFADHLLSHKRVTLARPDTCERTLRMVLAFWGTPPRKASSCVSGGVYHDLRLLDPIADPTWILRFDEWMSGRRLSASSKNSYRSVVSQLYKLALKPRWRALARVQHNPFEHIDRDRPRRRHIELSLDDIRRWMSHADPHARLALAIGALAPKLRLNQVLALRFSQHFDAEFTTITFAHHKTSRFAGQPQKTAIVSALRVILLGDLQKKVGPILDAMIKEKAIQVVFNAAAVATFLVDPTLDITQDLIKRLDSATGIPASPATTGVKPATRAKEPPSIAKPTKP
jgi:hypothetical protein